MGGFVNLLYLIYVVIFILCIRRVLSSLGLCIGRVIFINRRFLGMGFCYWS